VTTQDCKGLPWLLVVWRRCFPGAFSLSAKVGRDCCGDADDRLVEPARASGAVDTRVADVMTSPAVSVHQDTSLYEAGQLSQDRGVRPGTANVAAAVGLAPAAELTLSERAEECRRITALRDRLEQAITSAVPDAVIHGRGAPRAPHILSVSVPGTESESLLMALDLQGIACSAGSACQSGSVTPSHVLTACGVRPDMANASIRFSLGCLTTDGCIDRVAEVFPALIRKARGQAPAPRAQTVGD